MKLLIMQSSPASRHFVRLRSKYFAQHPVLNWDTGWTIGVLGFDFRCGLGICLFTPASRTALGLT